jgi:aminomethyltransferase
MSKTPISHEFNLAQGARLTDFNGWTMPVFYSSIIEEYKAVRASAGIFDVSHMGRWQVTGKDAQAFLDFIVTNDLHRLKAGRALYTCMLNEDGGIIDDLVIYKFDPEKFLVVNNAGNHEFDTRWYLHCAGDYKRKINGQADIKLEDITLSCGQIAVQGPRAKKTIEDMLQLPESLPYFSVREISSPCLILAATGYTGEPGYELYGGPDLLMNIWQDLVKVHHVKPCGLGARDLLRLEAGYRLHGHDISTDTSPREAGLAWTIAKNKTDFIGKSGAQRLNKKLCGLVFPEAEKVIPRSGMYVTDEQGSQIGSISSGNFSPMLNRAIALAYIDTDQSSELVNKLQMGSEVFLNIREKRFVAVLVESRFYKSLYN